MAGRGAAGAGPRAGKRKAKQGPRGPRLDGGAAAGEQRRKEAAWPALAKRHLQRQSRRELRGLDLFTIPDFLSGEDCESFIRAAEALGFQQQGSLGASFGEAFRDNGRVSLQSESIATTLWNAGLASLFQDVTVEGRHAVGLNPNIRFYRYGVRQRFGQHIDESVELGNGRSTLYTLLIYLRGETSDAEEPQRMQLLGGQTVFYDRKRIVAEIAPAAGMALLHIHGAKCLLHEAKPVLKGIKYMLRSDVVFQ